MMETTTEGGLGTGTVGGTSPPTTAFESDKDTTLSPYSRNDPPLVVPIDKILGILITGSTTTHFDTSGEELGKHYLLVMPGTLLA